jgi:hypothetical protein
MRALHVRHHFSVLDFRHLFSKKTSNK